MSRRLRGARGVSPSGVDGSVVVEADQTRWVLIRRDLRNERALADLPGPEDRDRPAVGQRIHHIGAKVPAEQTLGHRWVIN